MEIAISNLLIDSFAGTVPRATYEYFRVNHEKLDLTGYIPAGFMDELEDMPLKYQFIRQCNLRKACNLWYKKGILLNGGTQIAITHNNKEIFKQYIRPWEESYQNIQLEGQTTQLADIKVKPNQAVFSGSIVNWLVGEHSNRFFIGIIDATTFEANKLKLVYHDLLGTKIIEQVTYNGQVIAPIEQEASISQEWQRAWWYLPNGELPYDIDSRFAYRSKSKSAMILI